MLPFSAKSNPFLLTCSIGLNIFQFINKTSVSARLVDLIYYLYINKSSRKKFKILGLLNKIQQISKQFHFPQYNGIIRLYNQAHLLSRKQEQCAWNPVKTQTNVSSAYQCAIMIPLNYTVAIFYNAVSYRSKSLASIRKGRFMRRHYDLVST